DEAQLVEMIKSGQVAAGNVAKDGSADWMPLTQHPPFAAAQAAFQGGAAPPPAHAQTPHPGAVMQAGAPPAAAPAKKKGGMGALIGLLVAALVLIGGGAAAYMVFFSGTKPQLAKHVPKDTQLYVEAPDLPGALAAFASMDIIDGEKLKPEKSLKELVKGIAKSFDIKKDDAKNLVESMESFAVAGQNMMKRPKVAFIMKFSDGDGVEKLLESDRFSKEDKISDGAHQYIIDRADIDFKDLKDLPFWEKGFAGLEVEQDNKDFLLVWMSEEKMLVFGQDDLVEEIVNLAAKDGESLADRENFAGVKFESSSALLTYVDPDVFGDIKGGDKEDLVKGYLDDVKPLTLSMGFDDAGIRFTYAAQLKGKCLPEEGYADAADLDLYKRLPEETVAYLALSTQTDLEGKALLKNARKQVRCVNRDAEEKLEEAIEQFEKQFDFKLAKVLDGVGDQAIAAFVLDSKFEFDPEQEKKERNEEMAGLLAFHVGDKGAAEKAVKILREEGFEDDEKYEVSKKGAGFKAVPTDDDKGLPRIEVRFIDDGEFLVMTVGGTKVVKRIIEAFKDGKNTLEEHAPHDKVLGTISGSPHAIAWVDSGRAWKMFKDYAREEQSDDYDEASDALKDAGLSIDTIRLKGDDRLNSIVALALEQDGEAVDVKIQSINEHAGYAALGYAATVSRGSRSPKSFESPQPVGGGNTISACEDYFNYVERKCSPMMKKAMAKSIETQRTMIKGDLAAASRDETAKGCERNLVAIKRSCP
ncbi:hypothetical protein JYT28_00515, partial [Desulfobulbus sp. AH-315-M07]|nr:hypothetical protein [Desulfobulbus sp. AH-315-M07]